MKHAKYLKNKSALDKSTPEWKQELRNRFIEQAKKYFGVPYAKR